MNETSNSKRSFSCDGSNNEASNADHEHPKIFLYLEKNEASIQCPYCGHEFFGDGVQ